MKFIMNWKSSDFSNNHEMILYLSTIKQEVEEEEIKKNLKYFQHESVSER